AISLPASVPKPIPLHQSRRSAPPSSSSSLTRNTGHIPNPISSITAFNFFSSLCSHSRSSAAFLLGWSFLSLPRGPRDTDRGGATVTAGATCGTASMGVATRFGYCACRGRCWHCTKLDNWIWGATRLDLDGNPVAPLPSPSARLVLAASLARTSGPPTSSSPSADLTINLAAICMPADYNTRPLNTIYINFIDVLLVVPLPFLLLLDFALFYFGT
ncbi:unnamed protein product, partial [Urochloa humidicola]